MIEKEVRYAFQKFWQEQLGDKGEQENYIVQQKGSCKKNAESRVNWSGTPWLAPFSSCELKVQSELGAVRIQEQCQALE